jgi:transcriptional regulator with XRE-family HTH domain
MEPQELRKLRIAHRLSPSELAAMLGTSADDVLGWEAAKGSPQHLPIEPEMRRHILRALAVCRGRQKERDQVALARAGARRYSAQPFVPVLIRR